MVVVFNLNPAIRACTFVASNFKKVHMEAHFIGSKIAEARKKLNVSQAQLARHLFISPKAAGKWERGESIPDLITLNRLAKITGTDLI
jgi:DNA-binding transcriptional regulator YiaG